MKRIISLVLILILLLSFCSCKKEDSGELASPDTLVENNQPETNVPEVQKPEVQESEVKEPKTQEPENTQPEVLPENKEPSVVDKFPPCNATLEDDFAANRIIALLTLEESRKNITYSVSDFPEIDIDTVKIILNYNENTDARVTLLFTLNNGTKQKVLDSIKILETNPIVYLACPDYYLEVIGD